MRIAKWKWSRDPKSLAAGKILGNSSHESVLYLVNLVPGQYIFNLKVWDDQGKSSEDAISIHVKGHFFSYFSDVANRPDAKTQLSLFFDDFFLF